MAKKSRYSKKREQIVDLLKSRGTRGVTNSELSDISLRYGGHLGALYQLGYKISKESIGEGLYTYRFVSAPAEDYKGKAKASDVLKAALKETCSVDSDKFDQMMDELGLSIRYKAGTYN